MKRFVAYFLILLMSLGLMAAGCGNPDLTSAKLYIQQKNFPKAKESLEKVVAKDQKSEEGFYLLGYVNGELNQIDKMLMNFNRASKLGMTYEKNIKEYKTYYWAQNFNSGVLKFNRANKIENTDSSNLYLGEAIDHFKTAIKCQPDSVDSYKNLAFAYLSNDRADDAIEPYEKVLELSNSAESYLRLGDIYLNKGIKIKSDGGDASELFNKAIDLLEKGNKAYPENGDILSYLSNAYISADRLEKATGTFKSLVEKDSENPLYRYNYGALLLGANLYSDAIQQFEAAINIDPEYDNAIYNAAATYVKWGSEIRVKAEENEDGSKDYLEKFKLAIPHLEKYLELKPEESAVWELLGKVYANLGEQDKSMEAFNKADEYRK